MLAGLGANLQASESPNGTTTNDAVTSDINNVFGNYSSRSDLRIITNNHQRPQQGTQQILERRSSCSSNGSSSNKQSSRNNGSGETRFDNNLDNGENGSLQHGPFSRSPPKTENINYVDSGDDDRPADSSVPVEHLSCSAPAANTDEEAPDVEDISMIPLRPAPQSVQSSPERNLPTSTFPTVFQQNMALAAALAQQRNSPNGSEGGSALGNLMNPLLVQQLFNPGNLTAVSFNVFLIII